MTDRIDDYLDGKIDRADLTPSERSQADRADRLVRDARDFLEARETPDLTAAVMHRIGQLDTAGSRQPLSSRAASWLARLWSPREVSFRFRPVYGLVGAAGLVALVVAMAFGRLPADPRQLAQAPPDAARLFVQFALQAPEAMTVRLAGTFTDWQPSYELHQAPSGMWTITLPLTPGVHDYVFVVDGERWVPDPNAQQIDDGFGGTNSRIALLTPEVSRS